MTTHSTDHEIRRTPAGAVDIEFYEAKARRARADIFQDVLERTRVLNRAFQRAGLRLPGS